MVEILFKATPNLIQKLDKNYLTFISWHMCNVFSVKVEHNTQIVKIAKLTKIFSRIRRSDCTQISCRQRLTITLHLSQNMYLWFLLWRSTDLRVLEVTKLTKTSNFIVIQRELTRASLLKYSFKYFRKRKENLYIEYRIPPSMKLSYQKIHLCVHYEPSSLYRVLWTCKCLLAIVLLELKSEPQSFRSPNYHCFKATSSFLLEKLVFQFKKCWFQQICRELTLIITVISTYLPNFKSLTCLRPTAQRGIFQGREGS